MLALLLTQLLIVASFAATNSLTLEQSIEIALRNATAILKSENNVHLAGTQLLQGYVQFLPNLTTSAQYVHSSGKTLYAINGLTLVDQSARASSYGISSTLNLFNGLSDYASLKSALARKNAADLSLTRAREFVAIDVMQSFLQVVLDQEIIRIARRNFEASQAREKLFRAQTEVGQRTSADLYRQIAQTKADQAFLISSQTKLHDDQLILLRKLQLDLMQDYSIIAPKIDLATNPASRRSERELIDSALEARSDLKAAESALGAWRWDVTNARGGYYPRLDLNAGFRGAGTVLSKQIVNGVNLMPLPQSALLDQLGSQTGYSVGLYLTWNLFDRFITKLNVERADTTALNAEIDYYDLKLQIVQEVRQLHGDYEAAADQLGAAREGAQASEKAYEVIQGRYSVGASSFIDLLAAQAAMVQAEVSFAQASLAYMLQGKQLDYVLGINAAKEK